MSKDKQQQNTAAAEETKEYTAEEKAFLASVKENEENAALLKNKSLVKIESRSYANSIMRRNDALTETAIIDICIAAFFDHVVLKKTQCTVQQITKFAAIEMKTKISRVRLIDHLKKNKYHAAHCDILKNDILLFKV